MKSIKGLVYAAGSMASIEGGGGGGVVEVVVVAWKASKRLCDGLVVILGSVLVIVWKYRVAVFTGWVSV